MESTLLVMELASYRAGLRILEVLGKFILSCYQKLFMQKLLPIILQFTFMDAHKIIISIVCISTVSDF